MRQQALDSVEAPQPTRSEELHSSIDVTRDITNCAGFQSCTICNGFMGIFSIDFGLHVAEVTISQYSKRSPKITAPVAAVHVSKIA